MTAFYNENNTEAAAWLRELIKQGHIAAGDVDERSIEDVRPNELKGYTQCHFFAGIGVWSHALRRAGWPDDRPVWTGSCPCQPFSAAGKGAGFADERHLWPAFHHLIRECRPDTVLGEQVASKDGLGWIDLVSSDMEGSGYAFGAVDTCAAGFGLGWEESQAGKWLRRAIRALPDGRTSRLLADFADWACGNIGEGCDHIRQRLYWVADAAGLRQPTGVLGDKTPEECAAPIGGEDKGRRWNDDGYGSEDGRVANAQSHGRAERQSERGRCVEGVSARRSDGRSTCGATGRVADAAMRGCEPKPHIEPPRIFGEALQSRGVGQQLGDLGAALGNMADAFGQGSQGHGRSGEKPIQAGREDAPRLNSTPSQSLRTSPTNGFWRDADWLFCRDGKWRPVEPSTFPLAHGPAARVGRLRGYGNAIVAPQAQAFIETVMEWRAA